MYFNLTGIQVNSGKYSRNAVLSLHEFNKKKEMSIKLCVITELVNGCLKQG
jgi:hypothetical protein